MKMLKRIYMVILFVMVVRNTIYLQLYLVLLRIGI